MQTLALFVLIFVLGCSLHWLSSNVLYSYTSFYTYEKKNVSIGVCITGQLRRLELHVKLANILEPLSKASGQLLDVAFVFDGDTQHGIVGVDQDSRSSSRMSRNASYFRNRIDVERGLAPYKDVVFRGVVFHMMRRNNLSAFIRSGGALDHRFNTSHVFEYSKKLGLKRNISKLKRAAIHLRQFELLNECISTLRDTAKRYHQYESYHVFVRLREDVISPLPIPAQKIINILQRNARRNIATIVTSDIDTHGGMNDKGSFLNMQAAQDYFGAPVQKMKYEGLKRSNRSVNDGETNPETFLWNTYTDLNMTIVQMHTLFAPLRYRLSPNNTCLTGCAKVCTKVHRYCPAANNSNYTAAAALFLRGRERATQNIARGQTRNVDAVLASLPMCDEGSNMSECFT